MDSQNIPSQPRSQFSPFLLIGGLVIFFAGLMGGFYLGIKQTTLRSIQNAIPTITTNPVTPTILPTLIVTTTSKTANKIWGSIMVYKLDIENGKRFATVKLEATSSAGKIKDVLLWTDQSIKKQPPLIKPFADLIKIPTEEEGFIFVIFKDDQGNESQIYADATYPFLQRGKLAE